MNVTLDGQGYARIDNTYNDNNFSQFHSQIANLLNIMNNLTTEEIETATNYVLKKYASINENMIQFLNDWQTALNQVNTNIDI